MIGSVAIRTVTLFLVCSLLGGCAERFASMDVDPQAGASGAGDEPTSGAAGDGAGRAGAPAAGSGGALAGAGGSGAGQPGAGGTGTGGAPVGGAAGGSAGAGPTCTPAEAMRPGTAVAVFTWKELLESSGNCFRADERECALEVTSWGPDPGSATMGRVVASGITCTSPMQMSESCDEKDPRTTCGELTGSFTMAFNEIYADGNGYRVRSIQPSVQDLMADGCGPITGGFTLLDAAYRTALEAARWQCP